MVKEFRNRDKAIAAAKARQEALLQRIAEGRGEYDDDDGSEKGDITKQIEAAHSIRWLADPLRYRCQ